jgi:hypothetical protein
VTAVCPHGDRRPVPGGIVGDTAATLQAIVVGAWIAALRNRRSR